MPPPDEPSLTIRLSLSPTTLKRSSANEDDLPRLSVCTTLSAPKPITLDIRRPNGGWGGVALAPGQLSSLHFSFIDIATSEKVAYTGDEEDCVQPGGTLEEDDVLTLEPGKEATNTTVLEDAGDVIVMKLKAGHAYEIKLESVSQWWKWGTKDDLFKDQKIIKVDEGELKSGPHIVLESHDKVKLSVEA